jgi:Na+/alanine symporter
MEEKSVNKRSRIVKVLLVVAGISFVVITINFFFWFSTASGWEPAVENTFRFIHNSSMGLLLAAILGIVIVVIAGRLKTR